MSKKDLKLNLRLPERTAVHEIDVDPELGLTHEQVRAMKRAGYVNRDVKPPSKTVQEIVRSNVFTYFNFVFLILAIILICVRSWRDITFLPVIIANTLIGIFQEIRAKAVLDELTLLNAPTANVIRDGVEHKIEASKLVKNDVVVFRAGNQIPADAVVLSGEVAANESLLTGEAIEVQKTKGAELMSGSFIISGECRAKLTKVGEESYISQLTLEAKKVKNKETSEIIRSLNVIVSIAGVIIIPFGITLFCQSHFVNGLEMRESVQSAIASILGMIPEGLFLLSSIALAVSSMKLARNKVLLHNMKSIETLARVNVLCVDKTGTITENTMSVYDFVPLGKLAKDKFEEILSDFCRAQAADNATMTAMKNYFTKITNREVESVSAFSSEFKYSGINFEDGESVILGAPEFVLRDDYAKYQEQIEDYSDKGYRVLICGKYNGKLHGKKLKDDVKPYGFVLLSNPVRENAAETFKFFAKQGVDIKVISGDNPVTVSEIARRAEIKGADKYIDASTLDTDQLIADAMRKYTVFGRVTPEQKRKFVKALQADKKVVAMTGDGVNDVLALRDADCSVAMASGSDAAVQAAQVVLLDSDFAHMPDVVGEGRRVVNNLERSGSLFLVKNVFSVLISLLAIIFTVKYPLVPAQISLISMFTIGIPGFLLSQAPNRDLIKGHFVTNIMKRAIPGGLTDSVAVAVMVFLGTVFGLAEADISTACTIIIAVVGIIMVIQAAKPIDWYKRIVVWTCGIGLFFCYAFMPNFFGMTRMSFQTIILGGVIVALLKPLYKQMVRFTNWIWKTVLKFIEHAKQYARENEITFSNPFAKD